MALQITGYRTFRTAANSTLTQGQSKCSVSFFFRYDGTVSQADWAFLLYRDFYTGPWIEVLQVGGALKLNFAWAGASGNVQLSGFSISEGSTHHVAMVWDGDAGSQYVVVDGVRTNFGTTTGLTVANGTRTLGLGGSEDGSLPAGCVFTLDKYAIWDGYALSVQDATDLRDGAKLPLDVGVGATRRVYWSLAKPVVIGEGDSNVPVAGQGGLADGGGGGYHLSSIAGSGTGLYVDDLDWSPSVQASDAYVSSCGSLVGMTFELASTGAVSLPQTLFTAPTFKKNGTPLAASSKPTWLTGIHNAVLFPLSERVTAGDVITATAPDGWMQCFHGLVQGFADRVLSNRTGGSSQAIESEPKTLRVGVNIAFQPTGHDSPSYLTRNLTRRLGWASGVTHDSGGKITAMSATTALIPLHVVGITANGVDQAGVPGPLGLHVLCWDDDDPADPVDFEMTAGSQGDSSDANTIVVHRADLRNTGTLSGGKQVGKARVYDVQAKAGATAATRTLMVKITCASKAPKFSDLAIHGPGDFTYTDGVPVTVDRSDPYAASATALDRLAGIGSTRWVDSLTDYAGALGTSEPEHLQRLDDFRWGWGKPLWSRTVGHLKIRPYSTTTSPYVYTSNSVIGDKYDVTLAADMPSATAGDATSVTITWDAAAPVFRYLRLFAGTEEMRVEAISGTLTTGQPVTVTVKRGMNGTTPAAHPAGTIQAGYRTPSPTMMQLEGGRSITWEMVTSGPHELATGPRLALEGSGWPTLTLTDGSTVAGSTVPTNMAGIVWVTGPDTYMQATYWGLAANSPATLATEYDLNPATCTTSLSLPAGPNFPYAWVAHFTGLFPDADLHLNIPHPASDDMVREIAAQVRDHFPAGRRVYVELSNEPWNFGFDQWRYFGPLTNSRYPGSGLVAYPAVIRRSARVWAIFEEVFGARSGEIKRTLNIQMTQSVASVLNYAKAQSPPIRVDAAAVAPYLSVPDIDHGDDDPLTVTCQTRYDAAECVDLFSHHFRYDVSSWSYQASLTAKKADVDAYNAATGNACTLIGYEGGVELPLSAGSAKVVGTVSATNGSASVVGTGTSFTRAFAAGQTIAIYDSGGTSRPYVVQDVADATHLTLTENYAGATESGRTVRLPLSVGVALAGTVSVTNGSASVVGTGTSFSAGMAGWTVGIRATNGVLRSYRVASVADATHLTLASTYGGPTESGRPIFDWQEHQNTKARDMVYHPGWYWAEQEIMAHMQRRGFDRWHVFCQSGPWYQGRFCWPMYAWPNQDHGRGDGSDGKADNRLALAEPGQADTKSPYVSKDEVSVSPRGEALLDWNAGVGAPDGGWTVEVGRLLIEDGSLLSTEDGWSLAVESHGYPAVPDPDAGVLQLLLEDGYALLLESGSALLTEDDTSSPEPQPEDHIRVSPPSIRRNRTTRVTFVGSGTAWESTPPEFAASGVAGVSIGAVTVLSDGLCYGDVTTGSATGTVTWTDAGSGLTVTQRVRGARFPAFILGGR